MPKISVIVPIYGVEKYIERCAKSLFGQTLDDIEFIFVDDCTPDNSIKILEGVINEHRLSFIERSWTVKVERMPKNSGLAAVRKYGLQLATGGYIVHCDSDDWMEPNMCEILYRKACESNADLVFCDYFINSDEKETLFKRDNIDFKNKNEVFQYALVNSILNPVWGLMAKRVLYDNILYPTGNMSEDKTLCIQLIYFSRKISFCPSFLYHYRLTPGSILRTNDMKSIIRKFKDIEQNRKIIKEFAERYGLLEKYPKQFQSFFFQTKKSLNGYLNDELCRFLWNNSFPEYNQNILLNQYVSILDKILFLRCKFLCCLYKMRRK